MNMHFPFTRLRRNRQGGIVRSLTQEHELSPKRLILPLFVQERSAHAQTIDAMPGVVRHSEESVLKEVESCLKLGIGAFALFGAIAEEKKDAHGSEALRKEGLYLRTLVRLRAAFPEAFLISDVALDPYSSTGHDGVVKAGKVDNDLTLPILGDIAVSQAQAGASWVAPSDMMDGRIGHIRQRLDEAGYQHIGILAYSAKYASALYNPFRSALDSAPKQGDKQDYQMPFSNAKEAENEALMDQAEGADMLMVKPASWYLDVVYRLSVRCAMPIAAYQVSGEYAMIKSAAAQGYLEEKALIKESLMGIRRAGAAAILTYFAKDYVMGH